MKKNNGYGNIYGEKIEKLEIVQHYHLGEQKEYINPGRCKFLENLINELVNLEVAVNNLDTEEATKKWRGKLKGLYGDGHYLKIPVERYEGAKVYLYSEIEKLRQDLREKIFNELKQIYLTENLIKIYDFIKRKELEEIPF